MGIFLYSRFKSVIVEDYSKCYLLFRCSLEIKCKYSFHQDTMMLLNLLVCEHHYDLTVKK